jgi:hypothetical protein
MNILPMAHFTKVRYNQNRNELGGIKMSYFPGNKGLLTSCAFTYEAAWPEIVLVTTSRLTMEDGRTPDPRLIIPCERKGWRHAPILAPTPKWLASGTEMKLPGKTLKKPTYCA